MSLGLQQTAKVNGTVLYPLPNLLCFEPFCSLSKGAFFPPQFSFSFLFFLINILEPSYFFPSKKMVVFCKICVQVLLLFTTGLNAPLEDVTVCRPWVSDSIAHRSSLYGFDGTRISLDLPFCFHSSFGFYLIPNKTNLE